MEHLEMLDVFGIFRILSGRISVGQQDEMWSTFGRQRTRD